MSIKVKAVYALYDNVVKTVGDGVKDLDESGQPYIRAYDNNDNEVTLDMTDINNWVDPNAHQDKRRFEYLDIAEQLDLLYKDMLADKGDKTGAWFAAVKAVKDKYPKE
jgi:hypothetical protein